MSWTKVGQSVGQAGQKYHSKWKAKSDKLNKKFGQKKWIENPKTGFYPFCNSSH
jgi:hypothetical protein